MSRLARLGTQANCKIDKFFENRYERGVIAGTVNCIGAHHSTKDLILEHGHPVSKESS